MAQHRTSEAKEWQMTQGIARRTNRLGVHGLLPVHA
jgi:hypothetical protein